MKFRYMVATAAYCYVLWLISSDPNPGTWVIPWEVPGLDKLIHVFLYSILAIIVSVGMRRSGKPVSVWAQCFVPILFATLYGISDEIHQIYVPNRTFDIGDIIADLGGATIAQMGLCYAYWRRAVFEATAV